jgi:PHD/YefM family antitoxin component YafN of YafNO toxin-antitoxin module
MTSRIIAVTDFQRRFRAVFDDVAHHRIAYVLTRHSTPEVAMIPYDDFLHFQLLDEQQVLDRFGQLIQRMASQNALVADAEVASDIAAARAASS